MKNCYMLSIVSGIIYMFMLKHRMYKKHRIKTILSIFNNCMCLLINISTTFLSLSYSSYRTLGGFTYYVYTSRSLSIKGGF